MPRIAAPLRKLYTLEPDTHIEVREPECIVKAMPHCSKREYSPVDTIVIHCTAGSSTEGAYTTMLKREVSSHIIIPDYDRAGEPNRVIRLVPDDKKSYHVLRSIKFQGKTDINSRSLGIEIVNTGQEGDPYSLKQVADTAAWTRYWIGKFPIKYLVTHAYLDPTRRSDPCVTFPWDNYIAEVLRGVTQPVDEGHLKFLVLGKEIDMDGEIQDGTTWAEIRPLVEALGFKIAYDKVNRVVSIFKEVE